MSQSCRINILPTHPQIPSKFDGDSGSAIPIANTLNIQGLTVSSGTYVKPVFVTGSGNTILVNTQIGKARTGAPANSNDAGLSSFDDTIFSQDGNGYVTIIPDTYQPSNVYLSDIAAISPIKGDVLVYNSTSGNWESIGVGTDSFVITAASSEQKGVKWAATGASILPLTTKGDLLTRDASTNVRLGVGANGTFLQADSGELTGIKWAAAGGAGDVTAAANLAGDKIVRGDGGAKGVQDSNVVISDADDVTGMNTLTLTNEGLHLLDTNASHDLIIKPGSDLSADRILTITTGDAARTLTISGDATVTGSNTGDQTITLTGNVTGAGTGSFATTIAVDAVTYDMMQDTSATDKILGRETAGAGTIEEIACTAAGRAILDDASAGDQRTTLGLVIDTDVQAYSAALKSIADNTGTGADKAIYYTGANVAAEFDLTAAGRAILDDANAAAQQTTLGLVPGTDVQVYDACLTSIALLGTAADRGIYFTGVDTAAEFVLTAAGRAILDDANAGDQRTTMGVAIGSDVQAWDAQLDDIAALAVTDSNFIVGNGAAWLAESGATARTSLGVAIGSDVQAYSAVLKSIADNTGTAGDKGIYYTAANIAAEFAFTAAGRAIVDDATAGDQRNTIGVAIGSDVQAWDTQLDDIAALAVTNGNFIVGDGANWVAEDPATVKTTLGLGTIVTQNSNNVTITGGSVTSITDITVADGGTGRSTSTLAYGVICAGTTATGALQTIAALGAAGTVLTSNGAGALPTMQAGGGGSMPDAVFGGAAVSHRVNVTQDFAPPEYVDLGTVELNVRAFANATAEQEEFMQSSFKCPSDLDGSGTVTFVVDGWSKTAVGSKNVEFTFGHRALSASDAIDGAYTGKDSGDLAVDGTQDDFDILTFTETVSNLGWTANETVLYEFSRIAASADDLAGDYYVLNFFIRLPRA